MRNSATNKKGSAFLEMTSADPCIFAGPKHQAVLDDFMHRLYVSLHFSQRDRASYLVHDNCRIIYTGGKKIYLLIQQVSFSHPSFCRNNHKNCSQLWICTACQMYHNTASKRPALRQPKGPLSMHTSSATPPLRQTLC